MEKKVIEKKINEISASVLIQRLKDSSLYRCRKNIVKEIGRRKSVRNSILNRSSQSRLGNKIQNIPFSC
jgi:hypothetical protein